MPDALRILVVDDNRSAADALARVLRKSGDEVVARYDGASAIDQLASDPPDLVLTDLKMTPVDGMAVLKAARAARPPVECIVFTAFGDIDIAVNAMQLGARDFLTKPVTVEQVASRIEQLRRHSAGALTIDQSDFLALSASSKKLYEALTQAAGVPSRVWIEGEIGSGRVYCAKTIHRLAGMPPEAFHIVDPTSDTPWPSSGTALIQNVNDLPDEYQRQLVRALQTVPNGVRVICTAAPDGRRMVAEGHLRPELYFALAVVVVPVPPLRDRPEDILPLFERALADFANRYDRQPVEVDEGALADLRRHTWPGNVRELMNLAERTAVMGATHAQMRVVEASGTGLPDLEPGFSLSAYLENTERRILEEALRRCGGDRAEVGRLLSVERNTLRYKLKKYGLLGS